MFGGSWRVIQTVEVLFGVRTESGRIGASSGADMSMSSRRVLGILVFVYALIELNSAAPQAAASFGAHWTYPPPWQAAAAGLTGIGLLLGLVVLFLPWSLARGRRGADLLLASFLCTVVGSVSSLAAFLVPGVWRFLQPISLGLWPVASFLLALGLLRSRLVAASLGWIVLAFSTITGVRIFITNRLFLDGLSVSALLGDVGWLLWLLFLVAFGVTLYSQGGIDAEQALPADAPKVD